MAFFTKENPIYTTLGGILIFCIFGATLFYEVDSASLGNPPQFFRLATWLPIALTGVMIMFNSVARRKLWVIMFFLLIVGFNYMVEYWLIPKYSVSNGSPFDIFSKYKYDSINIMFISVLCGIFTYKAGLVYWKFSPYWDIVNPILRNTFGPPYIR